MDVREKLVELIESARYWGSNTSEEIADNLLDRGVTVQEWISVKDMLPNVHTNKSGYERKGVIVLIEGMEKSEYRIYERACNSGKIVYRWKYPWGRISDENITHWCEMPQPPKGE